MASYPFNLDVMSEHDINDNKLFINGISGRKPIVHGECQAKYHSVGSGINVSAYFATRNVP